ncbi:PKD domain-containing protein [Lunatibacter salilacus]|uniref:PKD domain-containing protein n=1 Tax=Lunatibacter salilacus TaxID=2483804 RepID=UPI00131C4ECA|nr:PKD domain-containing protein [Lunatibacter salilacus]
MKDILNLTFLAALAVFFSCTTDEDPTDTQSNPPEACFDTETVEGKVGDEFKFTNCSQHAELYAWDFGDGTTSTQKDPIHNYEDVGTYEVTLLAGEDLNGDGVLNASDDPASTVLSIEILPHLAVELTIYSASDWTPENPEDAVVPNATIYLYKDHQNSSDLGEPDYTFTSDENGKVMFYDQEVMANCFVVEKDGESNIVNGYLTIGVFQNQEDIDNSTQQEGASVGGFKFADINNDGVISASDQTVCQGISISTDETFTSDVFIGK